MGKHKEKKSKKHKKEKKHKRKERKYSSSSDSADEWVEKAPSPSPSTSAASHTEPSDDRDEWMSLPTCFASTSNIERRVEREANKRLEKEKETYNPRENVRELNPFWKGGGDGLPKFQKPSDDTVSSYKSSCSRGSPKFQKPSDDTISSYKSHYSRIGHSSWRKEKSSHVVQEDTKVSENSPGETVLSDGELNVLAARLVKAEILGNTALVAELKEKLESAQVSRASNLEQNKVTEQDVILTQTDSRGYSRPLKSHSDYGEYSGGKRKKQKVETHNDGQRVRYFADDDNCSLKQMFESEKYSSIEDSNREFMQLAGKIRKNDDLDDVFTDNIRRKDDNADQRNRERAINEHKETTEALDNCSNCLQSEKMHKHLMVSMSEAAYLSLPPQEPLTEGHCIIAPVRHASCSTQLDENEWAEVLNFRRALTRMFATKDEDVIFFETAMFLHRHPHMVLHCVPVPREQGDLAPIYFKKAIDESEMEWATNKKLVSLAGRDVRRAIPKGLPYFAVSFGTEEGFAHVVEDQRLFPTNFAQEIIGGMLDLHHSKWRKPKMQKFDEQKQRVLQFSKEWNQFDCTAN